MGKHNVFCIRIIFIIFTFPKSIVLSGNVSENISQALYFSPGGDGLAAYAFTYHFSTIVNCQSVLHVMQHLLC